MANWKIDLTTLSGWTSLGGGTYTIKLKSKASGYKTSEESESITVTKLDTPSSVTVSDTTISFDEVENAESYEIYADGVSIGTYTSE